MNSQGSAISFSLPKTKVSSTDSAVELVGLRRPVQDEPADQFDSLPIHLPASPDIRVIGPTPDTLGKKINVLQMWQGVVLHVDPARSDLHATLYDQTNRTNPAEDVVIDLSEVSDYDLALSKPGAIFYWSISYVSEGGTRSKRSQIRFRRLPPFSAAELAKARDAGVRDAEFFSNIE